MTQCLIQMTQFCLLFICTFPDSQFHLFLLQASHPGLSESWYCFCFSLSHSPLKVTLGSCLSPSSSLVFKGLYLMSSPIWPLAASILIRHRSLLSSVPALCCWVPCPSDSWSDTLQYLMSVCHRNSDSAVRPLKCLCLLRLTPSMMLGQVERSLKASWTKFPALSRPGM